MDKTRPSLSSQASSAKRWATPAKVDEVHLLLGGLEDLSEHHIRVLEVLITDPRDHPRLPLAETHWTTGTLSGVVPVRNELVSVAVQGFARRRVRTGRVSTILACSASRQAE
jgi:hypothetical protein